MTHHTAVDDAVQRLMRAAVARVPCAPVRDLLGTDNVVAAYAVQTELISALVQRGAKRVGRKIGLTSRAVQEQLGVGQPDFGVLLDTMIVPDGGVIALDRLLQPKIEAEVAFRLGADLVGEVTSADVRAAVVTAHAALEIVDSRIADWDITITDTVADNASSGMFVVADYGVPLSGIDPAKVLMELLVNGKAVTRGCGRACLGDPLVALQWLARTAVEFGDPLRAGDVVLSGALGPMVPVSAGDRIETHITGVGSAGVSFKMGQG